MAGLVHPCRYYQDPGNLLWHGWIFCVYNKILYSEGTKSPGRLAENSSVEGIFPDGFSSCCFPWQFQVNFEFLLNPRLLPTFCGDFWCLKFCTSNLHLV